VKLSRKNSRIHTTKVSGFRIKRTLISLCVLVAVIAAGNRHFINRVHAQSAPDERPKLKDFGSSLKRLKWDEKLGTAVENKSAPKKIDAPTGDDVIRVETNLVVCSVQVLDPRNNWISNLTKDDFIVTENGRPERVAHFSLGNDVAVGRTIVLLIDYSSSEAPYIKDSVEAAKILVDKLGPRDIMAIVTDDVKLLVDFTRDQKKLKRALDSLYGRNRGHQYGNSMQFSALMAVVREMFTSEDLRPIVIFQTDGDELFELHPSVPNFRFIPNSSERPRPRGQNFSLRDLYNAIEKSRTSVYTIIPGSRYIEAQSSSQQQLLSPAPPVIDMGHMRRYSMNDYRRWQQLAAAGAAIGGWTAYLQQPEEAADIYGKILADINSHYILGYYPSDKTHDGKRRRVQVEVRGHPEYATTGRKTYFAPEPDR